MGVLGAVCVWERANFKRSTSVCWNISHPHLQEFLQGAFLEVHCWFLGSVHLYSVMTHCFLGDGAAYSSLSLPQFLPSHRQSLSHLAATWAVDSSECETVLYCGWCSRLWLFNVPHAFSHACGSFVFHFLLWNDSTFTQLSIGLSVLNAQEFVKHADCSSVVLYASLFIWLCKTPALLMIWWRVLVLL